MDMLKTGSDFMTEKIKAFASTAITYHRGADTVSLLATLGKSRFDEVGASGVLVSFFTNDFIIPTADLKISGVEILPERGDYITCDGLKFYVTSGEGKDSLYRYQDGYMTRLRIHTSGEGVIA